MTIESNRLPMTKEIQVLEKKAIPLAEQAESFVITNKDDMTGATVLLSKLNKYHDSVVEKREEVTKPLNLALKNARAMFDPIEKPLVQAIKTLRVTISIYQTNELRKAQEEEEKIAARIGEGKGKLKIETAMAKIDDVKKPDRKIATDSGMIKFRTDKKLKVIDALLIPREYLVVDEKAVLDALKKGKTIPGAQIEEVQTPINFC